MQGIDYTPLTTAIALPCTGSLSHEQRNVLTGVLNAAEYDKDVNGRRCYQDAVMCLDTIHASIPYRVTIELMLLNLNQLVRAGLIEPFGLRYKLSGVLAGEYAQYKTYQTASVL